MITHHMKATAEDAQERSLQQLIKLCPNTRAPQFRRNALIWQSEVDSDLRVMLVKMRAIVASTLATLPQVPETFHMLSPQSRVWSDPRMGANGFKAYHLPLPNIWKNIAVGLGGALLIRGWRDEVEFYVSRCPY